MKKSVYLLSLLVTCFSLFAVSARAQAPVVTTDPANATICHHDTTHFSIAATGATPLTFIWEYSADGVMWDTANSSVFYSGFNNDTLRVIPDMSLQGFMYRCIAFNTAGSDTSVSGTLTVDTAFAGVISGAVPLCVGSSIALSSSVSGGVWSNVNHTVDTITAAGVLTGRSFGTDTVKYTFVNTCGSSQSWVLTRIDTVVTAQPITGPTHVCVASTVTLANANVIGTGVWGSLHAPATVSSTGVVTGVSLGSSTITYAFSNACNSVTSSRTVFTEVLPAAGTITGPATVCAGSWITLSSSVSGGIWLSGTTSVAVVSSVGNVTGIAQGSSLISYYQSNSCGASFSTHTVNVQVPAGAISGNDSVGIDSVIVLGNSTTGGTWSSADTTIAKFISGSTLKGMDTGMTTVTYSVSNTCGISSTTITMHVGPLPSGITISGPDTVCVGATITLTGSETGGTWSNKHDTISTVSAAGVVTGVEAGRDSIYYTYTTAFGSTKILKRIYVNEPPVISITAPSPISLGASYSLIGTPAGGTWSTNNPSMTPLIGYGFFVVIDTGTSIFTYTARNTCGTRSKTDTVRLPGTTSINGVAVANTTKLNVYPNPSQGALTLNITAAASESVMVTVSNVTGQTVKELSVMTNTPTALTLDQPAGIYLLTAVTADGNKHTERISITN